MGFPCFFVYSWRKSFRELNNAIKNQFFLYLGGLGQIKFLIEKNTYIWGNFLIHNIFLLQHDKIWIYDPSKRVLDKLYSNTFIHIFKIWKKVCLGPFLEDCKFQFCHAAAKKCCGSGNLLICPGDICSYKHNLSCYWPDFHQTLGTPFLFFGDKTPFDQNIFWGGIVFVPNFFLLFWSNYFFYQKSFCTQFIFTFLAQLFFLPKRFLYKKSFDQLSFT